MSKLEEVRASGKMSERILENNFRIFDHRLREMEGELKLCPYATLAMISVSVSPASALLVI